MKFLLRFLQATPVVPEPIVKSPKQAIAIALSEAGMAKKKGK